jgi:MFS family permease
MLYDKRYFLICAAALVDPLVVTSIGPLVPALKAAFNVNVDLVALSLTFHMIPFSVLSLFSGTLSDLYYRPKMLIFGLFLSFSGSLLGAMSPNILIFSLSRSLQGIGSALTMPITLAMLGDIIPGKVMGKAMGVYGVFLGVSTSIGPLMGGFLGVIDWRLLEFVLATYCIILAILIWIVFGIHDASQKKGSLIFLLKQFRYVAKNRNIIILSLSGFILFFTFQGIQTFISDVLSLPPLLLRDDEIGVIFSIAGVTGVIFSFLGGILVDKIGGRKTMALSFLMMMPSQFFLTFANSYWMYLIELAVLQGFQRSAWSSVQTLVLESLPEARGTASSIFNFTRYLGFGTAPAILATIYVAQGLNLVYMFNVILLMIGVIFAYFIQRARLAS